MDWDEYAHWSAKIGQWGAQYHKDLRSQPVRAQTKPGDIASKLPTSPPETAENMEDIFVDIDRIVMPGITHWQHPRFFAYFNANAAPPSMLADQVTSILAVQCMLWQTSPAATELETRVLDWLRQSLDLAPEFSGVIQDSASSATLAAVLTMRERALKFTGNQQGLAGGPTLRVYCSGEVHSSIDKAIRISGIGLDNLVKIPATSGDPLRGMDASALKSAIEQDISAGFLPAGIIPCVGATGIGACDNINDIMDVAEAFDLYTHVDAAWAGSAMLCPEFRYLWDGVDRAHSVVMNPHKWLGANFDLCAHFVRTPEDLVKTLAIQPDVLKTYGADGFINYSEWSIPLGRRFRALKLWFLIRAYGLEGLRQRLRNHVTWVQGLAERLRTVPDFEIVTEPILALFTFRVSAQNPDAFNLALLTAINDDGRIYLTQTAVDGAFVIRFTGCQFDATSEDVDVAFDVITEIAARLKKGGSMTPEDIQNAASALFAADVTGQQIGLLSSKYPDMELADAYAVQRALVAKKKEIGRRVIGWKIGLTSRAMQDALKIETPDSGVLFDDMLFEAGATIPQGRFIQPRIEAEIAFVMKSDLSGASTHDEVLAATEYVCPSLEILDTRILRSDPQTGAMRVIVDTVSDNAANAGVVLGVDQHFPNAADMRWTGAIVKRNGIVEETGLGAGVLDNPVTSMVWLTERLADYGMTIRAGDIVLSGSFIRPIEAHSGDQFHADFGAFGEVTVDFA